MHKLISILMYMCQACLIIGIVTPSSILGYGDKNGRMRLEIIKTYGAWSFVLLMLLGITEP